MRGKHIHSSTTYMLLHWSEHNSPQAFPHRYGRPWAVGYLRPARSRGGDAAVAAGGVHAGGAVTDVCGGGGVCVYLTSD